MHWFFVRIDNSTTDTLFRQLHTHPLFQLTIYQIDSRGIRTKNLGQINRPFRNFSGSYNMAELEILPGEESLFFIKADDRPWETKGWSNGIQLDLLTPEKGKEAIQQAILKDLDFRVATVAFLAVLFFLIVFTSFMYVQNKESVYIYYALYVGVIFIFYMARRSYLLHTPLSYVNGWMLYLEALLGLGFFIGYVHFIRIFLDVDPERSPHLYRAIRGAIQVLWGAVFAEILVLLISPLSEALLFSEWMRNGLYLAGGWLVFRVYQEGGKLSKFIIWGTFALVTGGVLVFATDQLAKYTGINLRLHPISYTQIGVLTETLIFALGLGYRTRLVREEKMEAELRYLKAQMNPHFVFNSLNSIKDLIQRGQLEESEAYLTKFARLLRGVLSFSERTRITVEEELELCQHYLRLEALRFDHRFHFEITADPELMDYAVPPLIFQPFLENAIWHGLLPQTGERWVSLRVFRRGDQVVGQIEDNGVGRARAATSADPEKKGSFGVRLAKERLKRQLWHAEVLFFDKFDKFGAPEGTIVELALGHLTPRP
ncbi:MAG: histidine kinase [Saprospirales bacterium]|nr:histidine kinase [Saprospirales bacterium]